jgi:hypothetical protein
VVAPEVCARILLDYFDPQLEDQAGGLLQNQREAAPKHVTATGRILHFLARKPYKPLGLLGRHLSGSNVTEEILPTSNHKTIVRRFNQEKATTLDAEIQHCAREE